MMEKIRIFFLYMDVFGNKPQFNVNGHKHYPSYLGSLITFILAGVIIFFFIMFSLQIFYHSNPNVVYTSYISEDPDMVQFTDNFVLTLGLQFPNYTSYLDEKVYKVKAFSVTTYYNQEKKEYLKTREPINVVKCTNYNFTILKDYFKSLPLDKLYCFDLAKYEIGGEFNKKIWKVIQIEFYKCENSEENNYTCKQNSEIEDHLKNGYIGGFITDYFILSNNYSNPIQIYGKNIFTSFDYKQYVDHWIYFKTKSIRTDVGLIFPDFKEEIGVSFEKETETRENQESTALSSLILRLSTNRDTYQRNYLKLHESIAEIGGFIKACFLTGELISKFFRDTLYKNFILQFFNLDESKLIENYKKNKKKKNLDLKNNFNGSNSIQKISNIPLNKSNYNSNLFTNSKLTKNNNNFFSTNILNKTKAIKFLEDKFKNNLHNNYINETQTKKIEKNKKLKKLKTINNEKKIINYLNKYNLLKNNYDVMNKFENDNDNCNSNINLNHNVINNNNYNSTLNTVNNNNFTNNNSNNNKNNYNTNININYMNDDLNNNSNNKAKINLNYINPRKSFDNDNYLSDHNKSIYSERNVNLNLTSKDNIINREATKLTGKFQYRHITKSFCFFKILCKKYGMKRIYLIKKAYEKIFFIFDIVQYIKLRNDFNFIQKLILNEEEKKELGIAYHYNYDLHFDKEGYDYLFHKKKNEVGELIKNKIINELEIN